MMIKTMLKDAREIRQLQLGIGEGSRYYTVDDDEYTLFTRIEAYSEELETWFAIFDGGGEPAERVNSSFVANVIYFKD